MLVPLRERRAIFGFEACPSPWLATAMVGVIGLTPELVTSVGGMSGAEAIIDISVAHADVPTTLEAITARGRTAEKGRWAPFRNSFCRLSFVT
jgi:hypothetical protein